jgi:hypothetical protein
MKTTHEEESQPTTPESPTNDASFSFFGSSPSSTSKSIILKRFSFNSTLDRIVEVYQLAQAKLDLVKSQCKDLTDKIQQAKVDSLTKQLSIVQIAPSPSFPPFIKMVDVKPNTDQPESSRSQNTTPTWEQWCNARYTSGKKAAMDIDGQGQTSIKQGEAAPVSNVDCKEKIDIEVMIQGWHAWAKTQKMVYKDKVSWSDLALRLTWGFRGNLHFW